MDSTQHTYFEELGIVLRKAGYTVHPEEDGLLPVEWNDRPLCRIDESGGIRYRQGDLADPDAEQALGKVTDIAGVVKEYTSLLDQAPERKKLLENMMEQIRDAVPNLAELVQRSNEKELEAMTEEQAQDMTQQM